MDKNYVLQFSMETIDGVEVPAVPMGNGVTKAHGNLYIVHGEGINAPTGRYIPALFMMYKDTDSNTFVVFGNNSDLNELVKTMEDISGEPVIKQGLKQYAKTTEGKKWKCRRVKGTDKDNSPEAAPEDRVVMDDKIIFLSQDAPDTDPTELSPLTIGDMEITEMKISIPITLAGYDLPAVIEEDI